jgi:PadR family transcriptional regulator PadR
MPRPAPSLVLGTLDLLILKTLSWGPRHGYAIARWLEDATGDVLQITEGSLYPALYRMEGRRWVSASWQRNEADRRIRVYAITTRGRAELRNQVAEWDQVVKAMAKVLRPA